MGSIRAKAGVLCRRALALLRGRPGNCLLAVIVLIALAYPFENWRGAKALEQELEIMQREGLAVDWHDLLRGPVPDAENFGATPVLKGLTADPPAEAPHGLALEFSEWAHIRGTEELEKPEEWLRLRENLKKTVSFQPPAGESNDARAIYKALDRLEPVFAELALAAKLPHAVLTPSPKERLGNAPHEQIVWPATPAPLQGLAKILNTRAALAVELHDATEAARMLRILARLHEARSDFTPSSSVVSISFIYGGLRRNLWTPAQLAELAGMISLTNPSAFAAARYHRLMVQDYTLSLLPVPKNETRFPSKAWWRSRATPQGWNDQGRAVLLRMARERLILPIRTHGLEALTDGRAGIRDDDIPWPPFYLPRGTWILSYRQEIETDILLGEMMRRLTILALAAERMRIEHGRFPADVRQILTALPPDQQRDLDGHPLRMKIAPALKYIVFYSVGKNLRDDQDFPDEDDGMSSDFDKDYGVRLRLP